MATRRHWILLSNLAPRVGRPGDLLFKSALGLGTPGAGAGFSNVRYLGSMVLPYGADDGGYILEIRAVDASGKIHGVYLNPKPINIAKAEATRDGSKLNVFVELRAPNYPGSTYTLTYDPQRDQLRGIYFQAVQQQTFNVEFVRMK